ncbi:hypothetical protein [Enterovibrio paralichthyis]|uniref:hypothetical protein n=1 Tax=Enterovibrio paralichthyis TaxID=2853805 RepID=UPI001C4433AD|nr:hypothetical protein [Enterovibrio paralichthyis]MBV7296762.1 hypothetical protein [Enterovibrio paralichthyis]
MFYKKLSLPVLIMASFSAGATVYDDITFEGTANCSKGRMLFPAEDVADNMDFFRNNLGIWVDGKLLISLTAM